MDLFIRKISSLFIDAFCIASGIGIWPRFVEPRLVKITELTWNFPNLPKQLKGLRIVQLSDLHFHANLPTRFLKKILKKVRGAKPDIIVFTGDFLCYSKIEDPKRLQEFLSALTAPLGSFCVFGNHDYASYVSRNREGIYDVLKPSHPVSGLFKGLKALTQNTSINGVFSKKAQSAALHQELCCLLEQTPFKLLENTCVTLPVGLNIVGLGEYGLGRCRPETAFAGYQKQFPGIVLAHNPDAFSLLTNFPGEFILSGHSHGEQIHFPFPKILRTVSKKLTRLENPDFSRGLYTRGEKKHYINRGIGCHKPLRFCSPPEILLLTLSDESHE